MSYEVRESEINYDILQATKRNRDGLTVGVPEPRTVTTRTDHNDQAEQAEVSFLNVAANAAGAIGRISSLEPSAGQVFTYSILSGNDAEHFTIDNKGYLYRAAEATLVGPYTLVCQAHEGSPLRRGFTVEVSITVA